MEEEMKDNPLRPFVRGNISNVHRALRKDGLEGRR